MSGHIGHWIDGANPPRGVTWDGDFFPFDPDEKYLSDYQDWQAKACTHPKESKVVIEKQDSIGRSFFRGACMDCGYVHGASIKHEKARKMGISDAHPAYFEEAEQNYLLYREEELQEILKDACTRYYDAKNAEITDETAKYEKYLRSAEWKALARKVMDRADGVCEGCLDSAAQEVHHLTYDHKYKEFAFELRALCRPCHERWHNKGGE